MFSVALIGADGAGKTTIARELEKTFPRPVKYLYMGINIGSSNVALPTSRFIEFVKRLRRKKPGAGRARSASLHDRAAGKPRLLASLWAGARLVNRLAEEWYRQFLAWKYRRRGQIVVYDRHFKFDFELEAANLNGNALRWTDWLHRWCLAHLYPRPDLVIYLDAPAEVLYARKGEASLQYLESRRQAFLRQGEKERNFVTVDATRPLDQVYAEVAGHLTRFCQSMPLSTEGQKKIPNSCGKII